MARKSTGKKLRFTVFERDGFTCQYCGKHPPEVILHLDHIYPVSKGGQNEIENLLTSCADCNGGKGARELGKTPKIFNKNSADLEERYEQLKAFYNLQLKLTKLRTGFIEELDNRWKHAWEYGLSNAQIASLRSFLRIFTLDEVVDAMDIALAKDMWERDTFRYMCGILHTKRKNLTEKNGNIT